MTREALIEYMRNAIEASPERPILIDRFLEDAHEFDVDAVADPTAVVIGGIMQHIESAGVHSGDSACVLPPYHDLRRKTSMNSCASHTHALGQSTQCCGLDEYSVCHTRRRNIHHRSQPQSIAHSALCQQSHRRALSQSRCHAQWSGKTLEEQGFTKEVPIDHIAVKEAVLPFNKFPALTPYSVPK